ncbi:hypothetical protein ACE3NQ_18715 [Paenibacillus terreus]|uniref:Uncharacterized protein n=1 Tax=Paenibacillus terreus TaxID=1387834 RepID=A0ABV5BB72_9BACL
MIKSRERQKDPERMDSPRSFMHRQSGFHCTAAAASSIDPGSVQHTGSVEPFFVARSLR